MATYTETVQQVTDQYLTALSTAQDTTVERITAAVAQLPEMPATVPAVELPAGVPTAAEVNAASFDAVEKFVAQQKAFADNITTFIAQLPELPATVPAVELPAGVPTAAEVNAASFAAVESLVANQRAFAEKFLAAAKV